MQLAPIINLDISKNQSQLDLEYFVPFAYFVANFHPNLLAFFGRFNRFMVVLDGFYGLFKISRCSLEPNFFARFKNSFELYNGYVKVAVIMRNYSDGFYLFCFHVFVLAANILKFI